MSPNSSATTSTSTSDSESSPSTSPSTPPLSPKLDSYQIFPSPFYPPTLAGIEGIAGTHAADPLPVEFPPLPASDSPKETDAQTKGSVLSLCSSYRRRTDPLEPAERLTNGLFVMKPSFALPESGLSTSNPLFPTSGTPVSSPLLVSSTSETMEWCVAVLSHCR
jgi:hypothetical protein